MREHMYVVVTLLANISLPFPGVKNNPVAAASATHGEESREQTRGGKNEDAMADG